MKNVFFFFFILLACSGITQNTIPESIDLSQTKYFPEVGNQGHIGACDWFASVYYQMTYSYNHLYNRKADHSNTFSPKFGYSFLNNGGIFPYNIRLTDVYEFVKKHGCATQQSIPYDMANGTGYTKWCVDAEIWENAIPYRIAGFEYFTLNNRAHGATKSFKDFDSYLNQIKILLAQSEVLVVQSEPFVDGVTRYLTVTGETRKGEHALIKGYGGPEHTMAVVGYNDNIWVDINKDGKIQKEEKGAIKIMDSFGADFRNRNNGAFWMLYSTIEESIFEHRVNRMFVRENYKAKIIARVTMNTARRDKVKFQFGRTESKEKIPAAESSVFDPYSLGFNPCTAGVSLIEGGEFAYDGGTKAIDGSFTFDLSDIYDENKNDYWYLRVLNECDEELQIKRFEIVNMVDDIIYKCEQIPASIGREEDFYFLKME